MKTKHQKIAGFQVDRDGVLLAVARFGVRLPGPLQSPAADHVDHADHVVVVVDSGRPVPPPTEVIFDLTVGFQCHLKHRSGFSVRRDPENHLREKQSLVPIMSITNDVHRIER